MTKYILRTRKGCCPRTREGKQFMGKVVVLGMVVEHLMSQLDWAQLYNDDIDKIK